MRKPLQVLRTECRALQLLRHASSAPWTGGITPPHPAALPPLPNCPAATPLLALIASPWTAASRQAKLRLLAPALRRALVASAQYVPRRKARSITDPVRTPAARACVQPWSLPDLLLLCLSPADAPQFGIHWLLV